MTWGGASLVVQLSCVVTQLGWRSVMPWPVYETPILVTLFSSRKSNTTNWHLNRDSSEMGLALGDSEGSRG